MQFTSIFKDVGLSYLQMWLHTEHTARHNWQNNIAHEQQKLGQQTTDGLWARQTQHTQHGGSQPASQPTDDGRQKLLLTLSAGLWANANRRLLVCCVIKTRPILQLKAAASTSLATNTKPAVTAVITHHLLSNLPVCASLLLCSWKR